jgi:hypothetical protein
MFNNSFYGNKNVKTYFIEFILIFLAVTLGSLAENYREEWSDRQKEKGIKNAMIEDMEKNLSQIETYKKQCLFQLSMMSKTDSLLNIQPSKVDQKEYYKALTSYSVVYMFTPSDESIKEAETTGIVQNDSNDSLSRYLLKYQYFLQDIRLNEKLELDEFLRYQKEVIPQILPSKNGIKQIRPETRERLDYFFAQMNFILTSQIVDLDSMTHYANRVIGYIERNK